MAVAEPRRDVAVAPAFLAVMAHELSQPLTAAMGSAVALKMRSVSGQVDEGKRAQLIDTAIRNLEQLQNLIGSLRVFSEAESGTLQLETTTVAVEELFNDAVDDFGDPLSGTRVGFTSEEGLEVNVDLMLFRQVLSNLISNAAKFSSNGSLVSIDARRDGESVVVTVSDEGEGFPPDEAERIFGKSVRLQPGKKGLGVGLFVAKAIVKAHGGDIWAENISEGAMFSFTVPAA